jgi:hypothetical protein
MNLRVIIGNLNLRGSCAFLSHTLFVSLSNFMQINISNAWHDEGSWDNDCFSPRMLRIGRYTSSEVSYCGALGYNTMGASNSEE